MILKKEKLKILLLLFILSTYAYLVNWYSANIGVLPIDTFGFMDSSNSVLKGHLPIRDFWIFTGLLLDYMGAFFLKVFGNNWNSYLAHSSVMNIVATLGLFFFLKELKLKLKYIFFYSVSFATLCYPLIGTPFAYVHAYIFSLLLILNLIIAINNKNGFLWFIFPYICSFAFLSMQTPTAFILLTATIFLVYYFYKYKDFKNLKFFIYGSVSSLILFCLFLYITKTPLINFIYQYILFPLTIGEGRIVSDDAAYVELIDQLNLKRLFGDFKFIHFFLLPLIFFSLKNKSKISEQDNIINWMIILSTLAFIFNQLITANQIYIFSLIPVLAGVLHYNLDKLNFDIKISYLIILLVLFATIKFHYRFNIDRKFLDLESVKKDNAISASEIHVNLKNLKWLSRYDNPENELKVLKQALKIVDKDDRNLTLITHYNFMSTVLNKNFFLLNRWYLWDNNTHPTENHKYFDFYKSLVNKNIKSNNVEVIYLLGQKNEIIFDKVKNYFTDVCFKSKTLVENKFSIHEIVSCSK